MERGGHPCPLRLVGGESTGSVAIIGRHRSGCRSASIHGGVCEFPWSVRHAHRGQSQSAVGEKVQYYILFLQQQNEGHLRRLQGVHALWHAAVLVCVPSVAADLLRGRRAELRCIRMWGFGESRSHPLPGVRTVSCQDEPDHQGRPELLACVPT